MKEQVDIIRTSVERRQTNQGGFTLVETLIALFVLTFGLLAAGQLILVAMSSASLSRSKSNAAVVAQSRLEQLADAYRQNPAHADVTIGSHGPVQVQLVNPTCSTTLNRYNVAWTIGTVPDPRPGTTLNSRLVTVTVTPINSSGSVNSRVLLNKIVSISTILSARIE